MIGFNFIKQIFFNLYNSLFKLNQLIKTICIIFFNDIIINSSNLMSKLRGSMMKETQELKLKESIQKLCQMYHQKQQLFKIHVPIHLLLITNLERLALEGLHHLNELVTYIKEQRDLVNSVIYQLEQSFMKKLADDPKKPSNKIEWAHNIIRLKDSLCVSHMQELQKAKAFHKISDKTYSVLSKQTDKYKNEVSALIKQMHGILKQMTNLTEEEEKHLKKLVKDSKQQTKHDSFIFLSEFKKLQYCCKMEFEKFGEHGQKIITFIKQIVKNQKSCALQFKNNYQAFLKEKKTLFATQKNEQKLWGTLSVVVQGIQDNCLKNFQKIVGAQAMKQITLLVDEEKSDFDTIIRYLKSEPDIYDQKLTHSTNMKAIGINMTFKFWSGVHLAGGWVITSFTPCQMYLTFDHFILLFDLQGRMQKKMSSSNTKVIKMEQNVIFLQQMVKGFFMDGKQEYQLKFDNPDRMQQFALFLQNRIQ